MKSLRLGAVMKRERSIPSPSSSPAATTGASQFSTPPTPQTVRTIHCKTALKITSTSSKKPRRNLLSDLQSPESSPSSTRISHKKETLEWVPLRIGKSELFLPLTFPTGQTFRWKQTGSLQYTGVVGSHLVSLKQLEDGDVGYCFHCSPGLEDDKCRRLALMDFLNMEIRLKDVWEEFSACDSRFAELSTRLIGARVLRQEPLECLVQFLCSSNNNIGRITKMVDFISSLGNHVGTVEGFKFYEFPTLERLSEVSEEELREAGFGYRAKYVVGTVKKLQCRPGGGVHWLESLRKLNLREAVDGLCSLPGVGPKVAACIALFSLDHHQAIPVDTHVWKIATKYLIPELAGLRITPKLSDRVVDAFVSKYGKYAGWAQTLLFIAELPSQKALLLPSSVGETEISEYNGSLIVGMVGENCFAIASDRWLGVQLQTIL